MSTSGESILNKVEDAKALRCTKLVIWRNGKKDCVQRKVNYGENGRRQGWGEKQGLHHLNQWFSDQAEP